MNFISIAISNIKGAIYCCIIIGISKSEATILMQSVNLTKKVQNIIKQSLSPHVNILMYQKF